MRGCGGKRLVDVYKLFKIMRRIVNTVDTANAHYSGDTDLRYIK